VPGGPADASQSIRQGDVLLRIDGFNCSGSSLKDIQPRVCYTLSFALFCFMCWMTRQKVVGAADSKCVLVLSRDGKQVRPALSHLLSAFDDPAATSGSLANLAPVDQREVQRPPPGPLIIL
jgi:C-terminal processing protease CtpA/Prc